MLRAPGRTTHVALGSPAARTITGQTARGTHAGGATAPPTLVVDLDTRHDPPADAARALDRAASEHATPGTLPLAKIDSLLRGNVAATVTALHHADLRDGASGATTVLAPALPSGGRTVLDGVVHVRGTPLHHGDTWSAEATRPPPTIADAIAPLPSRVLPLRTVRAGGHRLRDALTEASGAGEIPICDAAADTDLDTIAAAALRLPGVRFAGSGGLAAALGRALAADQPARAVAPPPIPPANRPLLVVVGTAEPATAEQLRRLLDTGVRPVSLDIGGPHPGDNAGVRHEETERLVAALDTGPTALSVTPTDPVDPAKSRATVRRLATTVRRALDRWRDPLTGITSVDLVLTGGETARRVLDTLGVTTLTPIAEVHHGAVHSHTPNGISVVTRPGSFGAPDSLTTIVEHLRQPAGAGRVPHGHAHDTDPSKGQP